MAEFVVVIWQNQRRQTGHQILSEDKLKLHQKKSVYNVIHGAPKILKRACVTRAAQIVVQYIVRGDKKVFKHIQLDYVAVVTLYCQ